MSNTTTYKGVKTDFSNLLDAKTTIEKPKRTYKFEKYNLYYNGRYYFPETIKPSGTRAYDWCMDVCFYNGKWYSDTAYIDDDLKTILFDSIKGDIEKGKVQIPIDTSVTPKENKRPYLKELRALEIEIEREFKLLANKYAFNHSSNYYYFLKNTFPDFVNENFQPVYLEVNTQEGTELVRGLLLGVTDDAKLIIDTFNYSNIATFDFDQLADTREKIKLVETIIDYEYSLTRAIEKL